jgi:hypothetical protein
MGFEKKVLDVVAKVVKQDETAGFSYGTLFVSGITAKEAAKIETKLIDAFKCGIIVSPQPNSEFSFDFV